MEEYNEKRIKNDKVLLLKEYLELKKVISI